MMHEFSTVDGFVEINESLAEMIKYVANEPSVGLFYVQQHIQKAVPNVINLKNNVVERTSETNLHTEDLEDSITMLRSMKGCGFPIADEMIGDIRKSLSIMSTKQPKRGLITNTASGPQTRTNSWGPASWGNNGVFGQKDSKATTNYFSTVFKTAKEKASNLKWSQLDPKGAPAPQADKPLSYPIPLVLAASSSTGSSMPDMEPDELPLSSQAADKTDKLREDEEEEYPVGIHLQLQNIDKDQAGENLPPPDLSSLSENYHDFKADKEAKLEEWLGGTGDNNLDKLQK